MIGVYIAAGVVGLLLIAFAVSYDRFVRQRSGLRQLLAVTENYPQLKASQNFLSLQNELTNTEDRIQAARRFYNNNVRSYNTRVQSFPSNAIAGMFHFQMQQYFEIDEAVARAGAPQVDLAPDTGTP